MIEENNFKRMCSFYASNIHLITMLLPYLSEKLGKGEKIVTFLENDLKKEVELLISNITLNGELKNKIKGINWLKTNNIKYQEIKNNLRNGCNEISVLVVGENNYIEKINANIKKYIIENKKVFINEIDAYELNQGKSNINSIVRKYKYLLNTSGEHTINKKLDEEEII